MDTINLNDDANDDTVDLIASGYEWTCPKCKELNRIIEYREQVTCSTCSTTFNTNPPEHAY